MNPEATGRRTERGNIFFIIMLAVVLFAALGFTFSRSLRQGGNSISETQAKMAAQEILAYSQRVDQAVQKLLLRGCSEQQISFENEILLNSGIADINRISNPNAPVDKSCHVFDKNGGGVQYQTLPDSYIDSTLSDAAGCDTYYGYYVFRTEKTLQGIEERPEITLETNGLKAPICHAINDYLGNAQLSPDARLVPTIGGEFFGWTTLFAAANWTNAAGAGLEYDVGSGWETLPLKAYCGQRLPSDPSNNRCGPGYVYTLVVR